MKLPTVYIMASERNGTLYIGVTSDLVKRVWEHRHGVASGFTSKHGVQMLVYFEVSEDIVSAITREKQLKKWHREWKVRLIEEMNPYWNDFYESILWGVIFMRTGVVTNGAGFPPARE